MNSRKMFPSPHEKKEYSPEIETVESITAVADERGLVAFFPMGNELFLDFDGDAKINQRVLDIVTEQFGWAATLTTISQSGNGLHMYIRLNDHLSNRDRVALQAALGSDPVREALSIVRLDKGSSAHSALFETEIEAERVTDWRKQFEAPQEVPFEYPF